MSDTPNMNITLATPGGDTNVWGDILNEGLEVIDSHDHSAGKGLPVPTAGLNIDADLRIRSNNLEEVKSVRMDSQNAVLSTPEDIRSTYVVNGNLYYNNAVGFPVQLTDGNSTVAPTSADTPPGIVLPYAGLTAPTGYLMANGAAVSRTTYSALFAIIGTIYGVGDNATTFNLPDLRGRTPIGAGTYTDSVLGSVTRTLAALVGAAAHILTTGEMPSHTHVQNAHTHAITDPGHVHTQTTYQGSSSDTAFRSADSATTPTSVSTASATTGITINNATAVNQNTGGDGSHANMQPSIVLNFIIKT